MAELTIVAMVRLNVPSYWRPGAMQPSIEWPDGKRFAFTIFDDTDRTTLTEGPDIYHLLTELGMRTTKSVWPIRGAGKPNIGGTTCEDPKYLIWVRQLQKLGFEVALHGASFTSSPRSETARGLEEFRRMFGAYPRIHVNHASNKDSLYWGSSRVSDHNRVLYRILTRNKSGLDGGSTPTSPYYWGDLAQEHITYVRNFVFSDINTLKCCPSMPYHDPDRPLVNFWFASSEGADAQKFCTTISERNQDRLEAEGGACIMYTHFGLPGFRSHSRLSPRFIKLMERLAEKDGWFVPVSQLLDFLRSQRSENVILPSERQSLERKWLIEKLLRKFVAS